MFPGRGLRSNIDFYTELYGEWGGVMGGVKGVIGRRMRRGGEVNRRDKNEIMSYKRKKIK